MEAHNYTLVMFLLNFSVFHWANITHCAQRSPLTQFITDDGKNIQALQQTDNEP